MSTDFINQLIQVLEPTLLVIVTAVASYVATKVKNTLERKANNEVAKQVIEDTVKYVQQVFKDLDGKDKLEKAVEKASDVLAEKGIAVSETEINMLIESAVYGIKNGMGGTELVVPEEKTGKEKLEG